MGNIYQIPCYFKSQTNKDKFFFAIPYTVNLSIPGSPGTTSSQKSLIVAAERPSESASTLDLTSYTTSSMCGNAWDQNTPFVKINDVYYSLQTQYQSVWNQSSSNYVYQQVTQLIKKDLGIESGTPQPDVPYTISSQSNYWSPNKKMYVSKNYLYLQSPSANGWSLNSTPGDSLDRYDPSNFDNTQPIGSQLGASTTILRNADNISIQSVSSSLTNNLLKLVGRRTDDPDLIKAYGDVDEAGTVVWKTQTSTTYSPVTIVKLQ